MPSSYGATGAWPVRADVRLEVDRLDRVGSDTATQLLRATGRAWAAGDVEIGPPVLIAGAARIAADPPVRLVAAPDGPRWSAEFRVPDAVAHAAHAWGVEIPRHAAPVAAEPVPAELLAVRALAARVGALLELVPRRDATSAAHRADAERLEALDQLVRVRTAERDARAAEHDGALLELDGIRADRDGARREAEELRAELARVEDQWKAATSEVRELRAKLRVSSVDRTHLLELLSAAEAERDALRARAGGEPSASQDHGGAPAGQPPRSGWFGSRSRPPRA